MSFNKKTICIFLVLIMAAVLAACGGQTAVPTATVAPTAEEPTAAPTAEPVVENTEETVEEKTDETVTSDAEKPAEAAAVEEAPADTAAADPSEAQPAENEAEAEKTEESPAAEVTEETEAGAEEETAADTETEETAAAAETEESAAAETEESSETDTEAQAAATVDGESVSLEDFRQMAVFNRYQYLNQYAQYAQMYSMYGLPLDSLDSQVEGILGENGKERLGSEVIDQLTYDKVLQFEAEKEGLVLTDEDVYTQLKNMFSYEEPAAEEEGPMGMTSFNVAPAATESEDDKYADFRKYAESILSQGYDGTVSFDFIRNYAKNILLDNRMFEASLEDRVFEAEMVNARHILVEDEDTAKDILARLESGEEWDALASENSLDTANKDNSGSLGWFGRGEMVAEFEEAAFALEPGEISEPVQTSYGYHIIASDGKEVRPLSGAALQAAQSAAYDEWTLEMRARHDIQSYPEVWMDEVPMEPAFVSLNPASSAEETASDTEAEISETVEETVADPVVTETTTDETVEETGTETVVTETTTDETVEETEAEPVEGETITEETVAEAEAEPVETEKTAEETPAETVETETENEKTEESEITAAAAETVDEIPVETAAAETENSESTAAAPDAEENAVAVINGAYITADEFVEEAVFNRYQVLSSYQQYVQYASMFGFSMDDINSYYENLMGESGKEEFGNQTIEQLFYAKMLDFEAEEMGISVSRKDAENQMKKMFNYEDASKEAETSLGLNSFNLNADLADEDSEDAEFRAFMEMDISMAFNDKVSYDFYLEYIRHSLVENAIVDKLVEEKAPEPKQEEQVNARHILVADEETAKEIIAKLEDGEEWNDLAAEYSLDTGNKDQGGTLGWFGRGVMVSEFEDAAFALEPGEISEPVQSSFGWHIIASDGKEMRPVDNEAEVRDELYNEWFEGLAEKYQRESYPEIWLPLVPDEPVFTPIEVEVPAEGDGIPTFHILSDEDGTVTDEEVAVETTENGEVELTIDNTEQTVVSPVEDGEKDEEELTIDNTEQEVEAYTVNNDAENADQPEEKPAEENAGGENAGQEEPLLLNNDGENK